MHVTTRGSWTTGAQSHRGFGETVEHTLVTCIGVRELGYPSPSSHLSLAGGCFCTWERLGISHLQLQPAKKEPSGPELWAPVVESRGMLLVHIEVEPTGHGRGTNNT